MTNKINLQLISSTRADYGLLRNTALLLSQQEEYSLKLIATGTHLEENHGNTISEIEKDGYKDIHKITMFSDAEDNHLSLVKGINSLQLGLSKLWNEDKPDFLLLLGDRFEIQAAATVATLHNIPIIHFHGGELSIGAIDEKFRHSITKLSNIHFVSTLLSRKRLIQMGENPEHVFHVGALGIENIHNLKQVPLDEINKKFNLNLKKGFFLVTHHPVTTEKSGVSEINEILNALQEFKEHQVLITMPNIDHGHEVIRDRINKEVSQFPDRVFVVKSLGFNTYLSAVIHSSVVIGNSSSGILEAPSLKTPTINIGNRQDGREQADSIFNCEAEKTEIKNIIQSILSKTLDESSFNNPYEKETPSKKVLEELRKILKKPFVKKPFFTLT